MLGKVRFDESITLKEDYVSWSKQNKQNEDFLRLVYKADGWTNRILWLVFGRYDADV